MTDRVPVKHSDDLVEEEGDGVVIAQMAVSAHCPKCNYDLSGLLEVEGHRCPECGNIWTIDELAHQHAAKVLRTHGFERLLWIMLPGPISCGVLFLGLVFGHLVWWLAAAGTIGYLAVTVVEWWQEAYIRSFTQGRGKWNRYGFVGGVVAAYLFVNMIEVAIIISLVHSVLTME